MLDRTRRTEAVALMAVGVLLLTLNDTAAKWLVARYDPIQITFIRNLLALPVVVLLVLFTTGRAGFRSYSIGVHAVRGGLVLVATLAFFGSMRSLSLAEATTFIFTAPIMIVVLAAIFLGERVNARQGFSVALGFVGVLIVVQPGMEAFQPASLQALFAASLYAVLMIGVRWVDPRDGLWTMMFWMTVFNIGFTSVSLFGGDWPVMRASDAGLLAVMAICGTGGAGFVSQAFRLAPAGVVAPIDYTALLWASLMGWLVWGTVPGWPVYAGAAVIVAAGVLLLRAGD